MEHRYLLVLGMDFAGTVEAVGDGVTRFAPGNPVFGVVTKPFLGAGSLAEYVTVPEQYGTERLPEGLDLATAGALGLTGSVAVDAIDAAGAVGGQTVLASGATGGVDPWSLGWPTTPGRRSWPPPARATKQSSCEASVQTRWSTTPVMRRPNSPLSPRTASTPSACCSGSPATGPRRQQSWIVYRTRG